MAVIVLWAGCAHQTEFLPDPKAASEAKQEFGPGSATATALLDFYRGPLNHLAAVRRGVCPMYPSCSQYARDAIKTHGLALGWVMAHDRLLRCGRDEVLHVPRIWFKGAWKYFDPVENNVRLHHKQSVLKEGKWLPRKPLGSKS